MIMWLSRLLGRQRALTPEALRSFLSRQAAFVAQKSVIDYCRVKAGRKEQEFFADPGFSAALSHCRWQTYAGSVQDVVAMAESWLRPCVPGREAALAAALARLGAEIFAAAEPPPTEAASIAASAAALPLHLQRMQEAPPKAANKLPLLAQAPLLATLPIHPDQRIGETPSITGALRFHMVSAQQEMERAFDRQGLAAALTTGRQTG
jgi:hypothetical protein